MKAGPPVWEGGCDETCSWARNSKNQQVPAPGGKNASTGSDDDSLVTSLASSTGGGPLASATSAISGPGASGKYHLGDINFSAQISQQTQILTKLRPIVEPEVDSFILIYQLRSNVSNSLHEYCAPPAITYIK